MPRKGDERVVKLDAFSNTATNLKIGADGTDTRVAPIAVASRHFTTLAAVD